MADHTAIYDRHAEAYSAHWDGYRTAVMDAVACAVGDGVLLDAGCGPGRDLTAFGAIGVAAIGVDLSPAMVGVATAAGHQAIVADLRDLPFDDDTFTGMWASASLVHLDETDAGAALAELARVTATGGVGYVNVKAAPGNQPSRNDWDGTGDDARWFRYWNIDEFFALARTNGWEIVTASVEPDSKRPGLGWVTLTMTSTT